MNAWCGPARESEDRRSALLAPPGSGADGRPAAAGLTPIEGKSFRMDTDDPRGYPANGEGPVAALLVAMAAWWTVRRQEVEPPVVDDDWGTDSEVI